MFVAVSCCGMPEARSMIQRKCDIMLQRRYAEKTRSLKMLDQKQERPLGAASNL